MKGTITCLTTGKFILLLLLLTILSLQEIKPQQDPIDQYPGIPFIAYPDRRVPDILPVNYDQLMQMVLYGIVASDLFDLDSYIDSFTVHNIKVLPNYAWGIITPTNNQNVIERYTNSHYTVWEAEGTNSADGNATLYRGISTVLSQDGKSVVAEGSNVPNGEEIIYGPGYPQNKTYNYPEADTIVQYTAEFRMKIEQIIPNLPQDFMDNIVCTIMVTNSNSDGSNPQTIVEKDIKVSDFNGWDNWTTIDTAYEFTLTHTNEELVLQSSRLLPKEISQCIQFKVIWRGLTYLNLYVDRIRVYDTRGFNIVTNFLNTQSLVRNLVQSYINNHTIVGWYGTDEPFSIDNYEPYRVVDSIIASVSEQYNYPIRLQAGMTGAKYGGIVEPGTNYVMAQDLYVLNEFWKRAKPKKTQSVK